MLHGFKKNENQTTFNFGQRSHLLTVRIRTTMLVNDMIKYICAFLVPPLEESVAEERIAWMC